MLPSLRTLSSIRIRELLGANLFVIAAILIAFLMAMRKIPTSLDDRNYLDYFDGNAFHTYWRRVEDARSHGVASGLIALILGEGPWSILTTLLSYVMSPAWCMRLMIFLINFGVLFSARRHVYPWVFLATWLMTSVGMVTLGYLQLRQGLAVMLLLNLRNYPVAAAIASLGVHRTAVYILLHPVLIATWRRALIATIILFIAISSLTNLILANADRGDDLQAQNILTINYNWLITSVFLLILHVTLLLDQRIQGSTRWLLSLSTIITVISTAGFFAFPILTGRFAYYPYILFAFSLSAILVKDLRLMRARTMACGCGFGAIVTYDFFRFTLDSDFFHSYQSLLY